MPNKHKKTAFSLFEIVIVIAAISIFLGIILGAHTMLAKARTAKAVQLTNDSPLQDIDDVFLWFESSQNLSFKDEEREDYEQLSSDDQTAGIGSVTKWYDRNPHPYARKNATASTVSQAPKYYAKGINNVPTLYFNGSSNYLTIGNSSSAILNDYSIFIVEKKESSSAIALLGSGSSTTTSASLEIGYSNSNKLYWHQGDSSGDQREYEISELAIQKTKLHSFINRTNVASDTTALEYYLNTNIKSTTNSGTSVDFSTTTLGSSLEIGRSGGSSLYQGRIGEIIILPFAVSESQRINIQEYLLTKWAID